MNLNLEQDTAGRWHEVLAESCQNCGCAYTYARDADMYWGSPQENDCRYAGCQCHDPATWGRVLEDWAR
jgi:hypothetical protein